MPAWQGKETPHGKTRGRATGLCNDHMDVHTLSRKLLRWYDRHGRDLPWRRTSDPYRILVSEIMLQQTQVDRVVLFYGRWLKRFPDWRALARATNAQVIRVWAGLGYNRRALALRDIARRMTREGVPTTVEGWRSLKGIGAYTAAAVSAFAQGARVLPIDTNIRRVLGRLWFGIPYPDAKGDGRLQKRTNDLLPQHGRFAEIPQALFDLATDVCKKIPQCAHCPMRGDCKAAEKFLSGRVRIPRQMVKRPAERRHAGKPFPNRIYRGRILKLVRERGRVKWSEVGPTVDEAYNPDIDRLWMEGMITQLIHEHFLSTHQQVISLQGVSQKRVKHVKGDKTA
ncbi:A/G-specific adenine glycosylase [Candidatus Parcubacteria bacterium]|nr:A/G-specific adenine glycosylase [Candidatus Parcubacteria bacterium]